MFQRISAEIESQLYWSISQSKNTLQGPFFDRRWHSLYFKTIGRSFTPLVLFAENLSTVVPLAAIGEEVYLSGGKEVSDYCDIIGPNESKSTVWNKLLPQLKKLDYKKLILDNIPSSSTTYSYFKNLQNNSQDIAIMYDDTTPLVNLPRSIGEYLDGLSRKYRHELKRKLRKFERDHPDAITEIIDTKNNIQSLISLMEKDARKKTFLTGEMKKFLAGLVIDFAESSQFHTLKINGNIASIVWFFTDHQTMYLYNSGFDGEQYSGAGFYLKAKNLLWAIEHGFTVYNFLQGNERYKYELGGEDLPVYNIRVEI